jgi:HAMP domain-containing protein
MTLRWRYLLAIVPLFAGLGIANALVLYFLGRSELVWGAGEQAKGAALTLAAFADPGTLAGPARAAERRAACEQFGRRLGGLSAVWFVESSGRWQATSLLETPGLRPPAIPEAAAREILRRREAVALLLERPDAPHDEAVGYAGVFGDDGHLRGVAGVTLPETAGRVRRQEWIREGAGLAALLTLLGWGLAEALTRLARRELNRLQAVGDALSRGDYTVEWTPGRIGELNDLGGTLRTVASLLRDRVNRTRRQLLQVDLFPRDAESVALWHQTCDEAADLTTPFAQVLWRRIGGRHPDDFFGRRETPHHWIAVVGRLDPAPGATALARIVQATTARDYFLGLGERAATGSPPGPGLLAARSLDLVVIPKDGRAPTWLSTADSGNAPAATPLPAARGVAGTLPREARQLAADFLQPLAPAELPLRAAELAGLLADRGEGVLLVFAFGHSAPPLS